MARVFGNFAVFGRNAMLTVKPMPMRLRKPTMGNNFGLQRQGRIAFEVSPAAAAGSATKFDFSNKLVVALLPAEVGEFAVCDIAAGPLVFERKAFDPMTNDVNVTKSLTVTESESGYNIAVSSDGTSLDVDVKDSEFFVIKNLMFSALPYLCGFPQSFGMDSVPDWMLAQGDDY